MSWSFSGEGTPANGHQSNYFSPPPEGVERITNTLHISIEPDSLI